MAKKGAVSIGLSIILSVIAGTAIAVSSAIIYVNTSITNAILPVQRQSEENATAIAALNTNISWIKSALQAKGFAAPDPPAK